jgi:glucose-1-phosphate cytidylyltransferase
MERRVTNYDHAQIKPWRVTLVETGGETQTGGRIKHIEPWVRGEEAFCLTYGDGLSDVDITASIAWHKARKQYATVTAVAPPGRFGALEIENGEVREFVEKPAAGGQLINGGFFVLSPKIFNYIKNDATVVWEHEPLRALAADRQLNAFLHGGFWQPMDTIREREILEELWASGHAPWKRS